MKKISIVLILISAFNFQTYGQDSNQKFDFSIRFASCFDQDTVNVKINKIELIDNYVLESDFSTGITDLAIYQDKDGVWVLEGNNMARKGKINVFKELKIEIELNGNKVDEWIKLRKGKIIFIDNCHVEQQHGDSKQQLAFKQYKKTVTIE